jgi:molecular chaperone DnaK
MAEVVGIDLGTSNTVVAHADGESARTLRDDGVFPLIPSIVSFHPSGAVLVGRAARERRTIDAKNTIFGAKRLIGRVWDSSEAQESQKRLPFELRQGKNNSIRVMARGEIYGLPEISAFVLRKAKAVAEAALGDTVDRAVITVPANFDELQREATKLAGRLAGLDVIRVLNEPTAAALSYGYGRDAREQIAVYDFGGGTFDLTLLSLTKTVFRVRATSGDMFLGGDDIDLAIANRIAETFLKKHYYDPRSHAQVFDLLRTAAEDLKMRLSTETEVTVNLDEVMYGFGGQSIRFEFTMTRAELNALIAPLVDRTLAVCSAAMDLIRASPKDFDRLVLVGGTTRIPLVRERAAELFGREPVLGVDPDEAVALGASIHAMAQSKIRPRRRPDAPMMDEIPETVEAGDPVDAALPDLGALVAQATARAETASAAIVAAAEEPLDLGGLSFGSASFAKPVPQPPTPMAFQSTTQAPSANDVTTSRSHTPRAPRAVVAKTFAIAVVIVAATIAAYIALR